MVCACVQLQLQSHEAASAALAAAQEEAKLVDPARQQAHATQQELASLRAAHEAVQGELAVAKGRLSAFDESCQHSLDRVQALSAALQGAQQAKVHSQYPFQLEFYYASTASVKLADARGRKERDWHEIHHQHYLRHYESMHHSAFAYAYALWYVNPVISSRKVLRKVSLEVYEVNSTCLAAPEQLTESDCLVSKGANDISLLDTLTSPNNFTMP